MRASLASLAVVLLSAVWFGPLPGLARHSFAAHMTMHMAVVAVAAPFIALAVAGGRHDPMRRIAWTAAPLAASLVELVIVWGWHAPVMHEAARLHTWARALEQTSFLLAGTLLWVTVLGGGGEHRRVRAASGVAALLLTSMHMTLLGALFALANRPLFRHEDGISGAAALADQQLGGTVMLIVGGASYLAGGLWLTGRMLWSGRIEHVARRESLS